MRRHIPLLVILICAAFLAATDVFEPVNLKLLDLQFGLLRTWFPQPAKRDVVVVGIDEETVKRVSEPLALWHRHLGQFMESMAIAKPAVVGVDIVLPDRSFDQIVPGYDKALLKGILMARREFPVLLAVTVDPDRKPRPMHRPLMSAVGDGGTGYALVPIDPDGIVRRFDEHLGEDGSFVPTLVGQIARRLGVEPAAGVIDYARGGAFQYVPMHRVFEWAESNNRTELERAFKDKPVLVGVVLPFTDRQTLPVALAAWEEGIHYSPGVLVHAQTLRSLLGDGLIHRVPRLVVLLISLTAAMFWLFAARALTALLLFLATAVALLLVSTWLLSAGSLLPIAAPIAVVLFALSARTAYETILQLRERRRLRKAFSGYVSPAVMDEILGGQLQPDLGGVNKFVCVMFSDIRGYTTRSESMTPQAVIGFLNRYFEQVVHLIHARGGSVVSFMGDGIMAVFGAPKPLANPCAEAFAAAREMLDYVRQFNADSRDAGETPIEIGIGLHGGEAVVGHVGSTLRHDYTAIGDVTNVASRLEGLTKEVAYRLVCSKTIAEQLPDPQCVTKLGPMGIKGHSPVEVYGYDKI